MSNINVYDLSLTMDESSYCYSFTAEIAEDVDYYALFPGEEVTLTFYSIPYKCIIDDKNRAIVFENRKYNISGRAITAKLGEGWSDSMTKTWEAVQASAVVAELCAEKGLSYEYNAHDWLIPAGVLTANNEFPIDVIRKIATACGAIIQTKADGTLLINQKYKTSPVNLPEYTPDLIIEDPYDITQLNETYQIQPKYNEVIVMNRQESSDSYSIRVLEEVDADGFCVIAIDLFPFKDSIDLFTSSHTITYSYFGKVIEDIEDEIVEIVHGEGSASRLIRQITAWEYIDEDLGLPSFDGTQISTEIKKQSILKISYTTEYHKYRIHTSTLSRPFQVFTVEED